MVDNAIRDEKFNFNISKNELKKKFEISAIFYKINKEYLCRKNCIINRKGFEGDPEIIIVMMNPGSCKPLGKYEENKRCECNMDDTQKQISILMEYANLNSVKIENLSDICEGNSQKFWEKYELMNQPFSIFDNSRMWELGNIDIPIIYAWGKSAMEMAKQIGIEENLKHKITYGYIKDGYNYYQRPLSKFMNSEDKIAWIMGVGEFLSKL